MSLKPNSLSPLDIIINQQHIIVNQYDYRLAQWSVYSPIAQEVAGSIPAQHKHLCA
jgi:hypothetical protein